MPSSSKEKDMVTGFFDAEEERKRKRAEREVRDVGDAGDAEAKRKVQLKADLEEEKAYTVMHLE